MNTYYVIKIPGSNLWVAGWTKDGKITWATIKELAYRFDSMFEAEVELADLKSVKNPELIGYYDIKKVRL